MASLCPRMAKRWKRARLINAFIIVFFRLQKLRTELTNFWRPSAKRRQTRLKEPRWIKVQIRHLYLLLQFTAGCRTVENRSVINTNEVKEEKRKKEATRLKELGNQVVHILKHQNYSLYYYYRHSEEESIVWLRNTTQAL